MRRALVALAAASSVTALALSASAASTVAAPSLSFGAPIALTKDSMFGGYEPTVVVDEHDNVVVTAHKQNHGLAASPDQDTATQVRTASWMWTSSDHGRTFHDLPGMTALQEQNLEFGDEGDLAFDDAHHLYFVDTTLTDDTFSRWKTGGLGQFTLETTRPVGPFTQPLDDRPWVSAHGNGVVAYFGQEGDNSYVAGSLSPAQHGDGNGAGRYTVYMSHDAGATFDVLGVTLKGSGWCRPAADHRPGSKRFVAICTDDGGQTLLDQETGTIPNAVGNLYAYVTNDDGVTWNRHLVGHYNAQDPWASWPAVNIASDGTIVASYLDHTTTGTCNPMLSKAVSCDANVTGSEMRLYSSSDGGVTWTPSTVFSGGIARYSWSNISSTGRVGVAYYWRANTSSDWQLYAGTSDLATRTFDKVQVSRTIVADKTYASPMGDFLTCAFGPDGKLHLAWTSMNAGLVSYGLNSDVMYAKEQ